MAGLESAIICGYLQRIADSNPLLTGSKYLSKSFAACLDLQGFQNLVGLPQNLCSST